MEKKCKKCNKEIIYGRSDKIFCSVKCKNNYHKKLRRKTTLISLEIDKILHRNRSILFEMLKDKSTQLTINRIYLEKKKFRFKYHTHIHINKQNKTYYWVYDHAWMSFSNDKILIIKK